ncbi:DUF3152 domain-containing protein [Streptomyces goshikiensis]|uniref:DUF3152 domain-containing protein n=1 Tax=Streptomyces goshikiensis TaxID=1942 RepID=UPI003674A8FC
MGRHSRKEPASGSGPAAARPAEPAPHEAYEAYETHGTYEDSGAYEAYPPAQDSRAPGGGFDAFGASSYDPFGPYGRTAAPTVTHQGYAPPARPGPAARGGGHPQQREPGGAWGAAPEAPSAEGPASDGPASGEVYGDWRGVPRARTSGSAAVPDSDTPASGTPAAGTSAFGTPAAGFPRVTLGQPDLDPATSTGSHRLVPGPRRPDAPTGPATRTDATGPAGPPRPTAPAGPVAPADPADPADPAEAEEETPAGPSRSRKVRAYTGVAAAAVTTVLAVVVAGQVATEGKTKTSAVSAGGGGRAVPGQSAASRGDGRATPDAGAPAPAAPELTFEQKMAQQLPIDAKLKGPGTFDTVPGVAKAPGKGKLVRYRVDVEQGLGLDPQLFAEAVQRTLNDDRSWSHKGAMTFERVPGGEADFVITLASPGTTGFWCAKSDLDTTVDNVSCDSASTQRVMINAFRWAQGSVTFGPNAMLAYRQMLINHEVGHRLGHGHVSCQTPGALAPIMQQQTKSLDLGGIHCQPNPWVFPGG